MTSCTCVVLPVVPLTFDLYSTCFHMVIIIDNPDHGSKHPEAAPIGAQVDDGVWDAVRVRPPWRP